MSVKPVSRTAIGGAGALLSAALVSSMMGGVGASSHRDAPMIAQDPVADNTDVYAFVSPDAPDTVTLISNFIPLEEPAGGPNFYNFGDDVLYEIHVDTDGNAVADVSYQFRFTTTIADPTTPLYNEGPISFENGGYKNLNVAQRYTVTEVRNGVSTTLGSNLVVPPNNVGPRSTPNYAALAANAVQTLGDTGIKVFAGQRDEVFPVDLGSIFDLGGLRSLNELHLLPLDAAQGVNATTGFNVHSIALQVPKTRLVGADPVIGIHSTTSRRNAADDGWVQVSRLGQPLVNEVVVPLSSKDTFNATPLSPGDSAFLPIVQDPRIAELLPVLYPGAFTCYPDQSAGATRDDLVTIFLTGIPNVNQPANVVPSEQLRLNTSIPPTAVAQQNPLGLLSGQADGYPNGRRLRDDVVDISLQALAGATPVGECAGKAPNNALGDGVSGNDQPYLASFPYMPTPQQGYDHAHDHTNGNDFDVVSNGSTMSRTDQIIRLYRAYFLRQPDSEGLNYWVDRGIGTKEISQEFAASAEFQNTYGSLSNRQFVELVYRNVLGRTGEQDGVAYWTGLVDRGLSRGQMMLEFSNAPEYRAKF